MDRPLHDQVHPFAQGRIDEEAFFDASPVDLARRLIGQILLSHIGGAVTAGIIVEVEAYLASGDAAAHSARKRSPATETLYGPPGRLYVHPMRQRCGVDIVAAGGSVLLRALEPVAGQDAMAGRRGCSGIHRLASGPARLTEALGISRACDGLSLLDPTGRVALVRHERANPQPQITISARIGLTRAVDLPLRFCLRGSRFLSRPEGKDQKNA